MSSKERHHSFHHDIISAAIFMASIISDGADHDVFNGFASSNPISIDINW